LYGEGDEQTERDTGGVEGDVERRSVPAPHEVLVHLVRDRVADAEQERRHLAPDRAQEQGAENRVFGQVGALPEDRIPQAEAGREGRNRREHENHAGPHDDRRPERETPLQSHLGRMIGSRRIGER